MSLNRGLKTKGNAVRGAAVFFLIIRLALVWAQDLTLPLKPDSLRFAVIGDSGTGGSAQYEIGARMVEYRAKFPFAFVLMLGDNLYGSKKPRDYQQKFERPYQTLLEARVKFYAALGNHDDPAENAYKLFNMNGQRYYTFKPSPQNVRFFVLDSNYMDKPQLEWVEKELRDSRSDWKICLFHHPLYSSGRYGDNKELRAVLEPLFVKYGVNVVFSGHEHFYERIKPQKGIYYFISGGAAKLRRGDVHKTGLTARSLDQDNHFMLVEISGGELYFQTISRTGKTVDSGVIPRQNTKSEGRP